MSRLLPLLEGPIGDALSVLAGILIFGWIGVRQDPTDPVQHYIGTGCAVAVTLLAAYAGWRAGSSRS